MPVLKYLPTAIFFVYYFFVLFIPALLSQSNSSSKPVVIDFSSSKTIISIILNSLLMLVIGLIFTKSSSSSGEKCKINLKFFCSIFTTLLVLLASGLLFHTLYKLWNPTSSSSLNYISHEGIKNSLIIFLLCLIIGYSEEILFRHAVNGIFSTFKPYTAHYVMAFLFGLAHLSQGLHSIIFSTIAGSILAYSYITLTKQYSPTLALHAVAHIHALYNFTIIKLTKFSV